jgi:hypothetical protein
MSKIDRARATLREAGYFVDNLWCVDDVEGDFTDERKQEILNNALTNEYLMEMIHEQIKHYSHDE